MPPVPRPPGARKRPNRNLIIAVAAAAVVGAALIVGSIVLTGGSDSPSATPTVATDTTGTTDTTGSTDTTGTSGTTSTSFLDGIPQSNTVLGAAGANVRLLQYEDLQCPICKRYMDDVFAPIVAGYVRPGKVKIDFRGLAFIGNDSKKALRVALAAGKQNKLWNVVELFYLTQREENSGWVSDATIDKILAQVPGLDAAQVKTDAQSSAITKEMETINAEATARKVPGTPWFYIGIGLNKPYEIQPQSLTVDAFTPALDDALKG
jgi:protein-disulfide isomerase